MDSFVPITFLLALVTSVFSGMSGGGGGFIAIPYLIALGIPPAQALATGKFGSLGVVGGSLAAFKGKGLIDKRYLLPFCLITLACALFASWAIPNIDPKAFKVYIGIALLAVSPTLFIKKAAFQPGPRTRGWIIVGFVAYTVGSFLQTILGSGLGTIIVIVMMYLFGMDALRANATKRLTQSVQSVVIFVLLAFQGLVVWTHGLALIAGTLVGTNIGTKIAIKKGAAFVKVVMAILMIAAGLGLLLL